MENLKKINGDVYKCKLLEKDKYSISVQLDSTFKKGKKLNQKTIESTIYCSSINPLIATTPLYIEDMCIIKSNNCIINGDIAIIYCQESIEITSKNECYMYAFFY